MSNLGPQFDPLKVDPLQEARSIKNNKSRLTRTLKAVGLEPRRRFKSRSGKVSMQSAGLVYTATDSNSTTVHYATGSPGDNNVEPYHQRILKALIDADYNASIKDGKIHVQHSM